MKEKVQVWKAMAAFSMLLFWGLGLSAQTATMPAGHNGKPYPTSVAKGSSDAPSAGNDQVVGITQNVGMVPAYDPDKAMAPKEIGTPSASYPTDYPRFIVTGNLASDLSSFQTARDRWIEGHANEYWKLEQSSQLPKTVITSKEYSTMNEDLKALVTEHEEIFQLQR